MINFTTVLSSLVEAGRRIIKIRRYGKDDVQQQPASAPYGIDSNPIKGMTAIYARTPEDGKAVIVGYINENAQADPGELRLFSTNQNGVEQTFIYIKNDGKIHLGGSIDNLIRHAVLNLILQQYTTDINTELAAISAAITGVGGTYVVTPITLDISDAKIDQLKTP